MTKEQCRVADWLKRAYKANKELDSLKEEKEKILSIAECDAPKFSNGGSCGNCNGKQEKYDTLADLIKDIEYQKKLVIEIYKEVHDTIIAIEDYESREILRHRYLLFYKMQDIAVKMNYDERTIQRKYIEALEKVVIECHL